MDSPLLDSQRYRWVMAAAAAVVVFVAGYVIA